MQATPSVKEALRAASVKESACKGQPLTRPRDLEDGLCAEKKMEWLQKSPREGPA